MRRKFKGGQRFVRAKRVQEVIVRMTENATRGIYEAGMSHMFCVKIQCIQDPKDSVYTLPPFVFHKSAHDTVIMPMPSLQSNPRHKALQSM